MFLSLFHSLFLLCFSLSSASVVDIYTSQECLNKCLTTKVYCPGDSTMTWGFCCSETD